MPSLLTTTTTTTPLFLYPIRTVVSGRSIRDSDSKHDQGLWVSQGIRGLSVSQTHQGTNFGPDRFPLHKPDIRSQAVFTPAPSDESNMFEGLQPFTLTTQDDPQVDIYGLKSGNANASRPALLLLHGFPQSRHIWHRVAPKLLDHYTLVIPDLRGYGESSKPAGAGAIEAYAKSAMARDLVSVMDQLGHQSFYVCGHDRGARVAHKMCVDFPDRVLKVMLLDICPTLAMYEKTDFDFAKAYFHWFFLIQPAPLPETMIAGNPRQVLSLFMGGRQGEGLDIFDKECFEYYASVMERPDAVHAMCNDYRAAATLDLEEARKDLEEGRRIKCPVRVLWGKYGVIQKCFDALAEWRVVSDPGVDVDGQAVESGHYIPEQRPDDVVASIREFFK